MTLGSRILQRLTLAFRWAFGGCLRARPLLGLSLAVVSILYCADAYSFQPDGSERASADTPRKGTKFITFGHAYTNIDTQQRRRELIGRINGEGADYVFILGDSDAWRDGVASEYRTGIAAKTYFVPGDHDLDVDLFGEDRKSKYVESIGYLDNVIIEHDSNFVLVNSSEDIDHIRAFWQASLNEINPDKVTVLLAHHRIWDDNLISPAPYQHDKSFRFDELFPLLDGQVDYIISGSSPYLYFWRPETAINRNIVYWCDVIRNIVGCSNGMRGNNASYLVIEVVGDELLVTPKSYPLTAAETKSEDTRARLYIDYLWNKTLKVLKERFFWFGVISSGSVLIVAFFAFAFFRRLRRHESHSNY